MVALSLKRIGVFVETDVPHLHGYLRGIRDFADEHKEWELFGVGMPCYREISNVENWFGDGSLYVSDRGGGFSLRRESLSQASVVIGRDDIGVPSVEFDALPGVEMAVKHFLEQGVQQFVSSEDNGEEVNSIVAGLAYRLGKRFLSLSHRELQDFLGGEAGPVGIFVANCSQAVDLQSYVKSSPVAICSLKDDPSCELASPSISSCAFPAREMGYRAAQLLEQQLTGKEVEMFNRVGADAVNVRASSLIHAYSDPVVQDAFRLIQVTVERSPLQVGELAKMLNVSRSQLTERFQDQVGKPPAEVIRKKRLDAAMHLLHQPGEMVKSVALSMGFPSSQEFARFFKKASGQTPTEYARVSNLSSK